MVYKSVNNQAPDYLTKMFVRLSDSCNREFRKIKTGLPVLTCNLTLDRIPYKGANLWNDLSFENKSSKNNEIFKNYICNVKVKS